MIWSRNALPEESKHILKNWNVSDEQGKNFGVLTSLHQR